MSESNHDHPRDEGKQRILDAALELFAEAGFARTSLSQIAKHAGVSKGLIHHHFSKKDDLIAAIIRARAEEVEALAAKMPADLDAGEKLRWFAHAMLEDVEQNPGRFRLYLRALTDEKTRDIADQNAGNRDKWVAVFEALGTPSPEVDARFFQTSLLGILTHQVLSPRETGAVELLDKLLSLLLPIEKKP